MLTRQYLSKSPASSNCFRNVRLELEKPGTNTMTGASAAERPAEAAQIRVPSAEEIVGFLL
jgi:hypothetical protein